MATRPQDYLSLGGRMTTNSVEGFHSLALVYRDKRTDLHHTHYVCKTNMAICHKVSSIYIYALNYYAYFMTVMIIESQTNMQAPVLCHDGGRCTFLCCCQNID